MFSAAFCGTRLLMHGPLGCWCANTRVTLRPSCTLLQLIHISFSTQVHGFINCSRTTKASVRLLGTVLTISADFDPIAKCLAAPFPPFQSSSPSRSDIPAANPASAAALASLATAMSCKPTSDIPTDRKEELGTLSRTSAERIWLMHDYGMCGDGIQAYLAEIIYT